MHKDLKDEIVLEAMHITFHKLYRLSFAIPLMHSVHIKSYFVKRASLVSNRSYPSYFSFKKNQLCRVAMIAVFHLLSGLSIVNLQKAMNFLQSWTTNNKERNQ